MGLLRELGGTTKKSATAIACQRKRKFPISPTESSPALAEWWLTVSGHGFTMTRSGEAKRSMVEINSLRNSRSQIHRDDEARGEAEYGAAPGSEEHIGSKDLLMPLKTHNERVRFPRLFRATATAAAGSELAC